MQLANDNNGISSPDQKAVSGQPTPLPDLPTESALFLDIDGTLVGHASHPSAIHIDLPLRSLLASLKLATGGAVALISGRSIADIDTLFSRTILPVAGQHGIERRSADGVVHMQELAADLFRAPTHELRNLCLTHPGFLLEEKGASLALHYRADPNLEGLAQRTILALAASLGGKFETLLGKYVVELRLSGKNKGTAIAEFMAEMPFRNRVPVFVGDDLTDEFGFDLVNCLGGLSVKVGEGPTCAGWRLHDTEAVIRWLLASVRRRTVQH